MPLAASRQCGWYVEIARAFIADRFRWHVCWILGFRTTLAQGIIHMATFVNKQDLDFGFGVHDVTADDEF